MTTGVSKAKELRMLRIIKEAGYPNWWDVDTNSAAVTMLHKRGLIRWSESRVRLSPDGERRLAESEAK